MKIRPVGAKMFHAERRADGLTHTIEAEGRFPEFCETISHKNTR